MDRTRMEADGASVIRRRGRARNQVLLALVVQNVLVASCLLLSLYVYYCFHWDAKVPQNPNTNVHIQFYTMAGISENGTLVLPDVRSQHKMSVAGQRGDTICVNCTGPYLLHMYVCHISLAQRNSESRGTLELQAAGNGTAPLASFPMKASHLTCTGLHRIVYLRAREQVSLNLYVFDDFKMKNLTVGLSLLLPGECEF